MPPRKSTSSKSPLLLPVILILVAAQVALMGYLLLRKKSTSTNQAVEKVDPLTLYVRAQKHAAQQQYLEALDALAAVKKQSIDTHLTRLATDLERRVRFELQLTEAQRLIKEEKWKPASHLLSSILEQDPEDKEAKRLLAQVNSMLALTAAAGEDASTETTTTEPETPEVTPTPGVPPKDKKGHRVPKAASKKVAVAKAAVSVKPGFLFVASTPVARVSIDGVLHGFTPLNSVNLPPGEHSVVLTRGGFRAHATKVVIVANQKKALDVQLSPEAAAVAPKVEPKKIEPKKVEAKAEPKKVEVKAEPKKVEVKAPVKVAKLEPVTPKPEPKPAPKPLSNVSPAARVRAAGLSLPAKLTVSNTAGAIGRVCSSAESAAERAVGRSAGGVTSAMQKTVAAGGGADVTLYPKTMAYLIAQALVNDWSKAEISQMLVTGAKSGRFASLAKINWTP